MRRKKLLAILRNDELKTIAKTINVTPKPRFNTQLRTFILQHWNFKTTEAVLKEITKSMFIPPAEHAKEYDYLVEQDR